MNSLDQMLRARSVAVVGASARPGTVGDMTMRQLLGGGFDGEVFPVNPGYDSLHGLDCHSSISDVGSPLDLAVLAVSNAHLETETVRAIEAGVGSLAIFASCHGTTADGTPLRDRIADLANSAGVPICGGNGMGFLNIEDRLRVCGFYQPPELNPGGVTFLSHSGSLFSAMLHNKRGIGFNLVVSTGLELTTRMNDYLDWALELESTTVAALFLETIRDPAGFVSSLRRATELDIPMVALKVGASERGRSAVATHSEAIAGDDGVYEAVFDEYGVHRVWSVDEMIDTIELFAAGRRATGGGLGAVHDSGGERALLIDTADRVGVPLPMLGDEAVASLTGLLDPGLEPANPVDAWGTGRDAEEVFVSVMDTLAADPAIGVVVFCVDLTEEEDPDSAYSAAALKAAAGTDKPVAVLANLSTTVDPTQATAIRSAGVPVLEGTETGLRAISHLLEHARFVGRLDRLHRLTPVLEPAETLDGFELLDRYGIPVPVTVGTSDLDGVLAAATDIGYPVVLKTAGKGHKTDSGGVVLGLTNHDDLERAYQEMASRLGPAVTVSRQVDAGVEIGLGMVRDPQFGPVVIVSAGGTLIEVLADRVTLLPPADASRARGAIDRLGVRRLLDGHRGRPPADIDGLIEVIVRFSELVADQHWIASIDVNPVIVGHDRAVAVDVLVERS